MGIHGTNPLEGLEEGSKEYLQTKKRLAKKDLESREGEIQAGKTQQSEERSGLLVNVRDVVFAAAFATATGSFSYHLFTPEGTVEDRAKAVCITVANESLIPATPESLSLCEQYARQNIKKEDLSDKAAGTGVALLAVLAIGVTGVVLTDGASNVGRLMRRRRELEELESHAAETREEIKGLDERLASLNLG